MVRLLLTNKECEAKPDIPELGGDTTMMMAFTGGQDRTVRLLPEARATLKIANRAGHTALPFATWHGHEE